MSKDDKNVTTPRCVVAGFTAIQEPTLDFNKTTEEYQMRVAMDAEDAADFVAEMEKLRDALFAEILAENPKLKKVLKKAEIGQTELDDDGEETGRVLFRFKQKAVIEGVNRKTGKEYSFKKKVGLFDSRGKPIRKKLKIGSGSVVKVSFEPNPYFTQKDKEVGISFNRLAAVQLIELVEYEGNGMGNADDHGFGDEGDGGFSADDYMGDDDDLGSGNDPADDDDETPDDF